jgi:hypothetical protein
VTNDRPWRLASLSFAPSGNGRERATINGVEVVRENGRYWITTPNGPIWSPAPLAMPHPPGSVRHNGNKWRYEGVSLRAELP